MAQRPTVTQMSRKFESHAFTEGPDVLSEFGGVSVFSVAE